MRGFVQLQAEELGLASQLHFLRTIALIALPLAVVAGCSGSERSDTSTNLQQDAVAEFAGVMSQQDQVTLDQRRTRIVETEIASCMKQAGFDYEPYFDAYFQNGAALGLSTDFTSIEYAQQHGFGLVDSAGSPPAVDIPADPNNEWLLAQSGDVQLAWSNALEGPTSDGSTPCRERGNDAFSAQADVDYEQLRDLYGEVRTSPEMIAAQTEWSDCATAAGFPASDRLDLINQFDQRLSDLTGGVPTNEVDSASLAGLRAEEIAAATATFPCSQVYDESFVKVFSERATQ